MIPASHRILVFALGLALVEVFGAPAQAGERPRAAVNGTLSTLDGVRVLRVWGTAGERGYAHGYLMEPDFLQLWDGFLASGAIGGGPDGYERLVLPRLDLMKVAPRYQAELRGILAGLESRAGGPVVLPSLGRALRYDDLLAVNCVPDFKRMGCSSFAAWGPMTKDGQTIAGRNMDWDTIPALLGTQIIVVHVPPADSELLGWVSVTWPGFIGCLTGMNAEGVTVSTHDASGRPPSVRGGFTPYAFLFRDAVESAHGKSAPTDIARVLQGHVSVVGNNMMVTWPFSGDGSAAAVFEFDGYLPDAQGVTKRAAEGNRAFLACTNHYRQRADPYPCDRYAKITERLGALTDARAESTNYLDLKTAWSILDSVSMRGLTTHHSVVFEPNKKLMHVAFSENGRPAPRGKAVRLDVSMLLVGKGLAAAPK